MEGLTAYNINGNINSPIFGIHLENDSQEKELLKFTKINRRNLPNNYKERFCFHDLIIYGHSLNKQDYNYFFPNFYVMNLENNVVDNKIIFLYSKHDGKTSEEIKENLEVSANIMFNDYQKYSGSKLLVNSLYTTLKSFGKIEFQEIKFKQLNYNLNL